MNSFQAAKQNAKDARLPRHSGSGRTGSPRKNGYGGWGTPGCELDADEFVYDLQAGNEDFVEGEEFDEKQLKERDVPDMDLEES